MVTDWRVSRSCGGLGCPSRRTNRVGRGLSLTRSRCGGCSTKYDRKSDSAKPMAANQGTLLRTPPPLARVISATQKDYTDSFFSRTDILGNGYLVGFFSRSLHSWHFWSLGLTVIFLSFLSLIQYHNKLRVALGPYIWWILKKMQKKRTEALSHWTRHHNQMSEPQFSWALHVPWDINAECNNSIVRVSAPFGVGFKRMREIRGKLILTNESTPYHYSIWYTPWKSSGLNLI